MANTKKKIEENENIEVQETKVDEQSKTIAELQEQVKMLTQLMLTMKTQTTSNETQKEDFEIVSIGTRLINGATIYSPRKEVSKDIPFNRLIDLDKYELDMLLKSNFVREWLEKDIIFITEPSVYNKKKIMKIYDLSDEAIIELITDSKTEHVVDSLNNMTKNFKDDPMIHCLFYRIVGLCFNGKLSKMPHETRLAIEKAFNFKIDDAQMLYRGFEQVK